MECVKIPESAAETRNYELTIKIFSPKKLAAFRIFRQPGERITTEFYMSIKDGG